MKKIFREDLKLNNKWFHRLFKILFIIGIIILIGKSYIELGEESYYHYKRVDNLDDRLSNKVSKIEDLLNYSEKFERHSYGNAEKYGSYGKDELYCSNKLYDIDNIKYIINQTGIVNFNRFFFDKEITIDEISKIIKNDNIKCIIKDKAGIDFLNPMEYFNDFGFYKKNELDYFFGSYVISNLILEIFSRLFVYLILVYIVYYKIILYIIYGKNKN